MTKRLIKLMALVFAVMLILPGCSMVKIDKEMDDAEIVAEWSGGTIAKGEAMETYNEAVDMYKNYYGITDKTILESFKGDILSYMVEERVKKLKAEELGLTEMSEEEKNAKLEEAKAQYDQIVDLYKDQFTEEGKSDEDVKADAQKHLAEQGYTLEQVEEQMLDEVWSDRLFEYVTKDVKVDDEAIKTAYDAKVKEDEETYAEDRMSFEYAIVSGEAVAWVPEGYRTVKHILVKLTDEQSQEIGELENKLDDVQYELDVMTEPEDEAPEEGIDTGIDPDVMDDVVSPEETEAPESKEDLEAEKAQLEQQIADLKAKYSEELMPKVNDIMARIEAGEDFVALIEEVGEDPGMLEEPAKTKGYYVSADSALWDSVFTKAAMSIDKVGGIAVSEMGNNGIHIIRYEADVPAGAVPMEDMRAELEETALDELKNETFDAEVKAWVEAANVKTYPERMK